MKILSAIIKHPVTSIIAGVAIKTAAEQVPAMVSNFISSKLTTKVTVHSMDDSYYWISMWLAKNGYAKNSRNLRVMTINKRGYDPYGTNQGAVRGEWVLTVGPGRHWFVRDKKIMIVTRDTGQMGKTQLEQLTFEVFGRSRKIIEEFLEEAKAQMKEDTTTKIQAWNGYWQNVAVKPPRHEDTIVLPNGQKERIFADVEKFLGNKEWYRKRGIPYHRGYLLSGPPGSGKTSMIDAIASKFTLSINAINLASIKDDDMLMDAFLSLPPNAIIALEDIDCIQASHDRKETKKGKDTGVTLGGLLNCLDGIVTPDGAIVIMTSNYPEKLDDALVRPGRADVKETFGFLGKAEQSKLSALYYDKPIKGVDKLIPASQIQSIFLVHSEDAKAAQRALEEIEESN
jgi:chaperone BCS1